MKHWLRTCCAIGVLAALPFSVPPRARACSRAPGYARIVSYGASDEPAPVPLGAGVLVEIECLACTVALDSAPPEIEVMDELGVVVSGTARWIDAPVGWSAYALWEPELPLAAGNYSLHWVAPQSDFALPVPFVVGGDAVDAPQVSFEAVLRSRSVEVGEFHECVESSCGIASVATQSSVLPVVVADSADEPRVADVAQFLYRLTAADGAGPAGVWRALGQNYPGMSVDFDMPADEYCVEIEALRVRDGDITSLGKLCVEDTGSQPWGAPQPQHYATCNSGGSQEQRDAAQETYRQAWCSDNADACLKHGDEFAEACGNYADVCGAGDAGVPDGAHPGGAMQGPNQLEPIDGSAPHGDEVPPMPAPRAHTEMTTPAASGSAEIGPQDEPQARQESASSSCAVQPARRDSPAPALLGLVAIAWLARRRVRRT